MSKPNITPRLSLKVMDMPVAAPDAEAVRAVRDAAVAIERTFTNGSDWRAVVGQLRLIAKILESPSRICKTCGSGFRVENGAAFALLHRGLAFARHCEPCRNRRRQERHHRGEAGRTSHRTNDADRQADGREACRSRPYGRGNGLGQAS
jgi:hypothetical protein